MKYIEIECKNVDLISVAEDMVQWLALMNVVITFNLHQVQSVSWLAVGFVALVMCKFSTYTVSNKRTPHILERASI
jgi:hypothetical protein